MAVNSPTVNFTVSEGRYGLGSDNYSSSMVFTFENTTSAGTPDDKSTLKIIISGLVASFVTACLVSLMFCLYLIRIKKRSWYLSICGASKKGQKAPKADEEVLMTDLRRKLNVDTECTEGSILGEFILSKLTNSSRNDTPVDNKMFQNSAHTDGDTDADDSVEESCEEKTSLILINNLDTWLPQNKFKVSDKSCVNNFQLFTSRRNFDEFSHREKSTERRGIVNNRKTNSLIQSDTSSLRRSAFLIGKEQSDDDSLYSEYCEFSSEDNLDNKAILCMKSEWNECRRKEELETDILLTSPEKKKDQEETAVVHHKNLEDISQIDTEKIDWNKVFIFLCERLGAEWRLFFLRLYGFSKVKIEEIDDRMSHIEETTRRKPGGNNSQCIIFDQFRAWKASEGKYASHLTICETLEDMNRNDLSHRFKEFMSKLPLVHYESQRSISGNSSDIFNPGHPSDTSFESLVNADMFIRNRFPNFQCNIMHKRYEEICITPERRHEQGDGEEENEMNTEPKSYAFHNSIDKGTQTAIQYVAEVHSQPQEPKLAGIPSLAERSRGSNGEERKINKKKFKRKRKKMHKHLYLSTESLSSDTFFIMAKALLESQVKTIPKDMYERFVRNLILDITQETGSSDVTILSLKVTEFQLNLSHQTSKERIYSLYAGEVRLILGNSVFERLSLYVNEARKRIVDKLPTEATTENYVFITYEGKPLLDKIQSQAATATAATTSTAAAARSDFSDCSDISVKEPSSSSSEAN